MTTKHYERPRKNMRQKSNMHFKNFYLHDDKVIIIRMNFYKLTEKTK